MKCLARRGGDWSVPKRPERKDHQIFALFRFSLHPGEYCAREERSGLTSDKLKIRIVAFIQSIADGEIYFLWQVRFGGNGDVVQSQLFIEQIPCISFLIIFLFLFFRLGLSCNPVSFLYSLPTFISISWNLLLSLSSWIELAGYFEDHAIACSSWWSSCLTLRCLSFMPSLPRKLLTSIWMCEFNWTLLQTPDRSCIHFFSYRQMTFFCKLIVLFFFNLQLPSP